MQYDLVEKFSIPDSGKTSDLPKMIRHRVHKDVVELLPDLEEWVKENEGCPGVQSEEWPVTYMFDGETVIVAIQILGADFETVKQVFTFKFPKDEVDKLLEEK